MDDNNSSPQPNTITPTATASETPPSPSVGSAPPSASPVTPAPATPPKQHGKGHLLLIAGLVVLAAGLGVGGYLLGSNSSKANKTSTTTNKVEPAEKELTVPQGATVIAQCAKGRGTQYALPKDIPLGPVYNVYEGKVIGIEFMVGKDDLVGAAKNYLNLPLYGVKYDHVNIGLLSQGHAGFTSPHYHVDIMMVPKTVTDKITCTT